MPSYFLQKSTTNSAAAEILGNRPNHHYCSSIHCSYYSCYQRVKHVIFYIFGYTDDRLKRELNENSRMGSHEYIIMVVHRHIISNDSDNAKIFKNSINELKSLRGVSDYENQNIEKDKSDEAFRLADSITKVLDRTFNL